MFENIVGHDENKKILSEFIENKNISHSYLFEGKEGVGKKLMAFEFAKNILQVENLAASPDFKYIEKMDGKKDIVVEQVRENIIDDVYIVPSSGDKKVYIVNDANYLNAAAQNALLKTLEEPPSYVVIILISSNSNAFLPTIISRVSKISFYGVTNDELASYVRQEFGISLDSKYIEFFEGSIGQAIKSIQSGSIEKFKTIDELYGYISKKDVINSTRVLKNINMSEDNILDYLEFVLYRNGKYQSVFAVERAKQRLKYNGNYDIVIDSMILRIIDSI